MANEKLLSVEVSPELKSAKKSVQFPFGSVLFNRLSGLVAFWRFIY